MAALFLALAVCLLGAVLYLALGGGPGWKSKVGTLGLVRFAVGLLVTLENVTGSVAIEAHATHHAR
jgi:hypothetical protein